MFNMQAKKSSSGQMFWVLKKRVIQENMFVIKWNLIFLKKKKKKKKKGNIASRFWELKKKKKIGLKTNSKQFFHFVLFF